MALAGVEPTLCEGAGSMAPSPSAVRATVIAGAAHPCHHGRRGPDPWGSHRRVQPSGRAGGRRCCLPPGRAPGEASPGPFRTFGRRTGRTGRCEVAVIAATGSAGVGRVPTVAALMHAGVVVGTEANGLGACADVVAEVARGRRRCPCAHGQHRGRQESSDGSKMGRVFEHWYRLDFLCVRRVRLTRSFRDWGTGDAAQERGCGKEEEGDPPESEREGGGLVEAAGECAVDHDPGSAVPG